MKAIAPEERELISLARKEIDDADKLRRAIREGRYGMADFIHVTVLSLVSEGKTSDEEIADFMRHTAAVFFTAKKELESRIEKNEEYRIVEDDDE